MAEVLALMALVFLLAWWLELRLPQAVLLGVPLGAWLWLVWQCRRLGAAGLVPAAVLLGRRLTSLLGGIGNEVVALGAGAYLGHLSVTFLTSMVAQVTPPGVSLPLLAAAMLVGWSLTMVTSPFTAAMMIMSRFTGMSAGRIGFRWNGIFLAVSLVAAALLLRIVS